MYKSVSITKVFFAAGLAVILTFSLSSCGSKEGCPNKITEVGGVKLGTNT